MKSAQRIEHVSLAAFFREPTNEYSYAAVRNRLLAAISVAEVEGYAATRDALVELLRELEAHKEVA